MANYIWKAGMFFHHLIRAAKERGETIEDAVSRALELGYSAAELDADDLDG